MKHKFVEYMPKIIEDNILYISIEFKVAKHRCPCGCGDIIVTSIDPNRWKLTYDGETVSLSPSIGNWTHKCKSHYFIKNDSIKWARKISDDDIDSVINRDISALKSSPKKSSLSRKIKKWFEQ